MSRPDPGFFALFCAFLVIAVLFWRAADRAATDDALLDARGILVQGVITDRDTGTIPNSGGQRFYELRFSYSVSDQTFDSATRISRPDWEQAQRGDPIDVTYLPSDPEIHRTRPNDTVGAGLPWRVFAIIFFVAGLSGVYFQLFPKRPRNT